MRKQAWRAAVAGGMIIAGMAERKKAPKCEDCFFHRNMLCALALDSPCPTFRPDTPQGLVPPQQSALLIRQAEVAPAQAA